MANCFLENGHDEVETAILLEKAIQTDLSTVNEAYANAVALTDGNRVFINSDDNLAKILPNYNHGMLKWLLWHEEYHKQLGHPKRYRKYLSEHKDFHITKDEVNIIMDILVHDSLSKMFPKLVETARSNLAQMRDQNSLGYTFTTYTLEEMLDEYSKHKKEEDGTTTSTTTDKPTDGPTSETDEPTSKTDETDKPTSKIDKHTDKSKPARAEGRHSETDWTKLEDISSEEFIDEETANSIASTVEKLKKTKFKLAKLTQTLNSMVTTEKIRTYSRPSYIGVDKDIMLKGRKYAKTSLYLVFDASGSMGPELAVFKEIISKAVPQAMKVPCEWFAGYGETIPARKYNYYKGTFKDIMPVHASGGYSNDGDRVIELCLEAEKKGYSPIGVTDGGGGIYAPEVLEQLQKTVLIGNCKDWLEKAKRLNPRIQILVI